MAKVKANLIDCLNKIDDDLRLAQCCSTPEMGFRFGCLAMTGVLLEMGKAGDERALEMFEELHAVYDQWRIQQDR